MPVNLPNAAGKPEPMGDRMFGRLACVYASIMIAIQITMGLTGLHAKLGDAPLLALVGLFAASWLTGTLAIGKGNPVYGTVGIVASTIAFMLPG